MYRRNSSIRDLKQGLRNRLGTEFGDAENEGIVDSFDVIQDHWHATNLGCTREILTVPMAFLGLLHVVMEDSKKSIFP